MEVITVGAAEEAEALRAELDRAFRALQETGVSVQIREVNRGGLTFLGCNFASSRAAITAELSRQCRRRVAHAVSDLIVNNLEERLLDKLIRGHYGYLTPDEREVIFRNARQYLSGSEPDADAPAGGPGREAGGRSERPDGVGGEAAESRAVRRKVRILNRLSEYLEAHNEIVVDGFVTFRLKDYVEELEEAVDTAVDDLLLEKEYREFVRLLQYFVEMQEPRLKEAHVLQREGGRFEIVDAAKRPIRDPTVDELASLDATGADREDLLVSALITLAPRSVCLHGVRLYSEETVRTVQKVFGPRVTLCGGCAWCEPGTSR